MQKKSVFVALYFLLLAFSWGYESYSPKVEAINYRSEISDSKSNVLYIGGLVRSDLSQSDFTSLSEDYNIVEVEYGSLLADNSNLSASAYADAINKALKRIDFQPEFLISEGFGSIVATKFIHLIDFELKSQAFVNPEGIIEYDLLGGHHLNKGVFAIKSGLAWTYENLIPDFGFFEKTRFSHQIFKSHLDTDLRESRSSYRKNTVPTLILNADNASSNQLKTAKEIHRIIIQSKYIDTSQQKIQQSIKGYFDLSEPLSEYEVSAQVKSRLPFSLLEIEEAKGWLLIGLILLIIFSTFVSEDLACIGAGLLAARGIMGFFPAVAASFIGIFVGDILVYLSGRWFGEKALRKAPFRWLVTEKDVARSNEWFKAKGPAIIIMSRFIPGTRFPTYFSAGIIGASFLMFVTYFGIASLLWTPVLVGAAMFLGQELIEYFYVYQEYALWVLLSVILFLLILIKIVIPLFTYKGRRLLYGKWQRIIRWEFWPSKVIYIPVALYSLILWFRYKKITVVTAANPGIEEGGFIGESKSGILNSIKLKEHIARFHFLDSTFSKEELFESSCSFIADESLSYPVVLKPDKGERGKSVQIINNETELEHAIKEINEDFILQEFISGKEFGIFYIRYPNEDKGRIFSVTIKEPLYVTGDGESTLEKLILSDARAVCLAQIHFDKHFHDLYSIPKKGEQIKLVEIGTHSRGSIFKDGRNLITKSLTEKIDQISQNFDGFYFGRYDIKVPDSESLTRGEEIKVIELNGVTSESTNIYDPKHSFLFATKTLIQQWKIAFEIGSINFKKGEKIPGFTYLMKKVLNN